MRIKVNLRMSNVFYLMSTAKIKENETFIQQWKKASEINHFQIPYLDQNKITTKNKSRNTSVFINYNISLSTGKYLSQGSGPSWPCWCHSELSSGKVTFTGEEIQGLHISLSSSTYKSRIGIDYRSSK